MEAASLALDKSKAIEVLEVQEELHGAVDELLIECFWVCESTAAFVLYRKDDASPYLVLLVLALGALTYLRMDVRSQVVTILVLFA